MNAIRARRIRVVVDILAGVATVFVCGAVVWTLYAERVRPSSPDAKGTAAARKAKALELVPETAGTFIQVSDSPLLGRGDAPTVVVVFSDFQCPYCGAFANVTVGKLRKELIDTGSVDLVFKHLPLQAIHKFAMRQSLVSACAASSGKFWELHDVYFRNQGALSEALLERLEKGAGLDPAQLMKCVAGLGRDTVTADMATADRLGVQATPTALVGRRRMDGTVEVTGRIVGGAAAAEFVALIKGAVDGKD